MCTPNYLLFLEMENQISSAPNSGFCSIDGSTWSEESGWTMYFDDFVASCSGSSLISDATSYAAWKPSESDRCRKLRLKKRKQRNFVDDDDPLEDTATSPFDSFKDYELRDASTNTRKKDDPRISSQVKQYVVFLALHFRL
ncbi:hypothetical protein OPV22_004533 [Ensete ventricosum]|uniref:Uncharacterized protein n=1 Tax=Ensete ventricosum TaxID=4639 RepID=A0AAV8S3V2_ENSVE|nr:hypothetical protein OPV22_004533 [Ensete ventricosum]